MNQAGRVIGLDHVAIAVKNPRERLTFWADQLGLALQDPELVASEGVRVWFLNLGSHATTRLELLESVDEGSSLARSIATRGEGLHHICLRVEAIDSVIAQLKARQVRFAGEAPRAGAHGTKVAFVHPQQTGGVLVELVESQAPVGAPNPRSQPGLERFVIAYLHSPKERLFGSLERLDSSGVMLRAIELESWDSYVRQAAQRTESSLRPTRQFIPMLRVERLLDDEDAPELPSLARQFRDRTGATLASHWAAWDGEAAP